MLDSTLLNPPISGEPPAAAVVARLYQKRITKITPRNFMFPRGVVLLIA